MSERKTVTMATAVIPDVEAPASTGPSADEREARLIEGADQLASAREPILNHPQILLVVAATLMTTGLAAIVLGWIGASHSILVEEQIPYLISGGLLGLALATIGALTVFAHWLTELLREARRNDAERRREHVELLETLTELTTALNRREDTDARARGAQPERPVRRAPRRP